MTINYPGVYVREVSSGVRPIQAASTSTAAFFGKSERGPIGKAIPIVNFTEFRTIFGGFLEGGYYLAHSVFQFFNNGGSRCYVVRVAGAGVEAASATIKDRQNNAKDTLKVSAISAGVWGNALEVAIVDSATNAANTFDMVVSYFTDAPEPVVERFSGLSMNPASLEYVQTKVNARSKLVVVKALAEPGSGTGGFVEGSALQAVPDLDAAHRKLIVNIDGDSEQEITLEGGSFADLNAIATAMQAAIRGLERKRTTTGETAFSEAKVEAVPTGTPTKLRITSGTVGPKSSVAVLPAAIAEDAARVLGLVPAAESVDGSAVLRPATGNYLIGDGRESGALSSVVEGKDGGTVGAANYINALPVLDTVSDVSMIAIPGVGDQDVVGEAMNYCKNRPLSDCFYLADMSSEAIDFETATRWTEGFLGPVNSYGAVYFPWLDVVGPNGGAEPIPVPPSGFVAGVFARTDTQRGVWKTPAGTQAAIAGAVGLTGEITNTEHGVLNEQAKSVSVIRRFTSSGLVVWGGRTISNDAEWRYIAPRRMAIFLRVSIFNGIQWAVFEPNDEPLWSQLRLNLTAFMMTLFRRGAFQGSTPSEAFFVKVDSETTTKEDINDGRVNILVGFAPLKPAEFVVVELSQSAGQAS